MSSGFFEIGIFNVKTEENIGTLWRSAYQLGASGIFTIGRRYSTQSSDTCKTWQHIPLRHYTDFKDFNNHRPYSIPIVGIEFGGTKLLDFAHPQQAIYLLGAEDYGLSQEILNHCQYHVSLISIRQPSFNVAVAGSIIMYDRANKC